MQNLAIEISATVHKTALALGRLPEAELCARPAPGQWSKKEIIGHLVDSALNNIQRFVRGQYEDTPHIVYAQDFWVTAADYQNYNTAELLQLWELLNRHLCRILLSMPPEAYARTCDWGKETSDPQTLEYIARDYLSHMRHHIEELGA